MASILDSLLNSFASSLPAALSNVLSTTNEASAQINQYVTQIEGAIDNPAMVSMFAHDIMATPSVPPEVAFVAAKIMTLAQGPNYNPTLVMALCQSIVSKTAQQNSSILGSLAGFASSVTGTSTTTTTTTLG
jgi:hypothetical protein